MAFVCLIVSASIPGHLERKGAGLLGIRFGYGLGIEGDQQVVRCCKGDGWVCIPWSCGVTFPVCRLSTATASFV